LPRATHTVPTPHAPPAAVTLPTPPPLRLHRLPTVLVLHHYAHDYRTQRVVRYILPLPYGPVVSYPPLPLPTFCVATPPHARTVYRHAVCRLLPRTGACPLRCSTLRDYAYGLCCYALATHMVAYLPRAFHCYPLLPARSCAIASSSCPCARLHCRTAVYWCWLPTGWFAGSAHRRATRSSFALDARLPVHHAPTRTTHLAGFTLGWTFPTFLRTCVCYRRHTPFRTRFWFADTHAVYARGLPRCTPTCVHTQRTYTSHAHVHSRCYTTFWVRGYRVHGFCHHYAVLVGHFAAVGCLLPCSVTWVCSGRSAYGFGTHYHRRRSTTVHYPRYGGLFYLRDAHPTHRTTHTLHTHHTATFTARCTLLRAHTITTFPRTTAFTALLTTMPRAYTAHCIPLRYLPRTCAHMLRATARARTLHAAFYHALPLRCHTRYPHARLPTAALVVPSPVHCSWFTHTHHHLTFRLPSACALVYRTHFRRFFRMVMVVHTQYVRFLTHYCLRFLYAFTVCVRLRSCTALHFCVATHGFLRYAPYHCHYGFCTRGSVVVLPTTGFILWTPRHARFGRSYCTFWIPHTLPTLVRITLFYSSSPATVRFYYLPAGSSRLPAGLLHCCHTTAAHAAFTHTLPTPTAPDWTPLPTRIPHRLHLFTPRLPTCYRLVCLFAACTHRFGCHLPLSGSAAPRMVVPPLTTPGRSTRTYPICPFRPHTRTYCSPLRSFILPPIGLKR